MSCIRLGVALDQNVCCSSSWTIRLNNPSSVGRLKRRAASETIYKAAHHHATVSHRTKTLAHCLILAIPRISLGPPATMSKYPKMAL